MPPLPPSSACDAPDIEVVGVGDAALGRSPLAEACIEAARAVTAGNGGVPGTVVVGLVSGVSGGHGATGRPTLGAYSPASQTVLLFLDALSRAGGDSLVRRLLRVLAHELTHVVQHARAPGVRNGGAGSVLFDGAAYDGDPLEREAGDAAAAFEAALRRQALPRRLLALVERLEARGVRSGPGARQRRRRARWALDADETLLVGRLTARAAIAGIPGAWQLPRPVRKALAVRLREIQTDALWEALAQRTAAGPVRLTDADVALPLREAVRRTLETALEDLAWELRAPAALARDVLRFYGGLERRAPVLTAARRALRTACRRTGVVA